MINGKIRKNQSASKKQLEEINRFRLSCGMPELKPVTRVCLKCGNRFTGTTQASLRTCDRCRKDEK